MHYSDKSVRIYVCEGYTLHMWFLFDPHIHVCGMFRPVTNNTSPLPVGTLNWTSIKESFCGVWSYALGLTQSPWHSGDHRIASNIVNNSASQRLKAAWNRRHMEAIISISPSS